MAKAPTPVEVDDVEMVDDSETSPRNNKLTGDYLKLFWTLAESDVTVRTTAVTQLISHLQHEQKNATSTFQDNVQYTLKRLVRGLASSRDAARQGFSSALVSLLTHFADVISLAETLQLLRDAMQVHASMKGMEQREHMFGRLFGLLALHRTGRLGQDQNVTVMILKELLEMSKWKKWLREACIDGFLSVLSDLEPDQFVKSIITELMSVLDGDITTYNADQVALATGVQHYIYIHNLSAKLGPMVSEDYSAFRTIRRKQMALLVEPLKSSSSSYPRVHTAWYGIFGHILHVNRQDSSTVTIDSELLQETWTVLIENGLLAPSSTTHERKGLALKIFEMITPSLPSSLIRTVLTPHFVKCLYNNTTSKKTYLQEAARHTMNVFQRIAPTEYFYFLKHTFIQPMKELVEIQATEEETKEVLKRGGFDAIIAIEEERERAAAVQRKLASVRVWALDHMMTALSRSDLDESLKEIVLRFLVFHSFFKGATLSHKKPKTKSLCGIESSLLSPMPVLSATVRNAAVKRLFSILLQTTSHDKTKSFTPKESVLRMVFTIALEMMQASNFTLYVPFEAETVDLLKSVEKHVAKLMDIEESSKKNTDNVFLLLLMSCGLQLLDAEQRSEVTGVVQDLIKCYTNLNHSTPSKKKKKKQTQSETNGVDAVVVLTDLLLSLLSQDSSSMRELVTHVFRDLIPLMNLQTMETLVAVVAPSVEEIEEDIKNDQEDDDMENEDEVEHEDDDDEEEVVLSSASDIADALRSDEGLADLHREDQTLSAIVGQVKDKRKAKQDAKKVRMGVLHFKLRVLELISMFISKCPTSSLVVHIVEPLFTSYIAISGADVEQRVLKERLQSILLHKVIKTKDLVVEDPEQVVTSLEQIVSTMKIKVLDKEKCTVGAAVIVYLVRVLSDHSPRVRTILHDATLDLFTKKHSKFPRAVLEELVTKFTQKSIHLVLPTLSAIAAASSPNCTDTTHGAVDEFSRSEVYRLLSLLLKSKYMTEESEQSVFAECRSALLDATIALFQHKKQEQTLAESDKENEQDEDEDQKKKPIKEGGLLKAKHLKVYLSFAQHLVKVWNDKSANSQLTALVQVVESLETNSPVIKGMIKQLVAIMEAKQSLNKNQNRPKKRTRDHI